MSTLKTEISQLAATFIADHGQSYGAAKQKAITQLLGRERPDPQDIPSSDELDQSVLEHLELFDAQAHQERLRDLREAAIATMQLLEPFDVLVGGAAWKGIATEQAFVHLLLFVDNSKEIEAFFLDRGINYELSELPDWRIAHADSTKRSVPALVIERRGTPVAIALYDSDAKRGALKQVLFNGRTARGTLEQLRALMDSDDDQI